MTAPSRLEHVVTATGRDPWLLVLGLAGLLVAVGLGVAIYASGLAIRDALADNDGGAS